MARSLTQEHMAALGHARQEATVVKTRLEAEEKVFLFRNMCMPMLDFELFTPSTHFLSVWGSAEMQPMAQTGTNRGGRTGQAAAATKSGSFQTHANSPASICGKYHCERPQHLPRSDSALRQGMGRLMTSEKDAKPEQPVDDSKFFR